MKIVLLTLLLIVPMSGLGQSTIDSLIDSEHSQGHFNGSVLVVKDGKVTHKIYKGLANFQFKVPIDSETRFPIASSTKLFTTLAILRLQEENKLALNDSISRFLDDLPSFLRNITVSDLLLHVSGLANEPIKAYISMYGLDDYLGTFLSEGDQGPGTFNYNNVDYVLLTRILETVTGKTFAQHIQSNIIDPLGLKNTGMVEESGIIEQLAYGYHNYTFGTGHASDPLYNDRRYLSNYYGAGALYSTTEDIFKLLKALQQNILISEKTREELVIRAQMDHYVDWLDGKPTYGFFINADGLLGRSGNIDGFNSLILTDKTFQDMVMILANTDTGDLTKIGKEIFELMADGQR
ncbi:serine hydrolase domain-containing protein [Sinomicrobium sp. M5D2P9]